MDFRLLQTDPACRARRGRLSLPHGELGTPAFMPVGTQAAVKGLLPETVRETGTEILLCNAYHLALRPGSAAVRELGGLHQFMGWDGPILTDSGGFQVFSLAPLRRVTDEAVEFRSHVDGATIRMSPERATEIQNDLGADIIMCFDECPPASATPEELRAAVRRTLRWAEACRRAHRRPDEQALFGIVQGGALPELRAECARALVELDFPGYAVGGVSVGEAPHLKNLAVEAATAALPADRPRYLMGVGFPPDLLEAVERGIDLFDCVAPTRMGRNATAFTADGRLRLRNARHADDDAPLEPDCPCPACRRFSRAYLRHLFAAGEMLGPILLSIHNITFYQRLMARAREAVADGRFAEMKRIFLQRFQPDT
jgi:queuine tRNA-ribosyltransferase